MPFSRLFHDPRWRKHSLLVPGWSEDQLTASVERLIPWLPNGLTDQMRFAVASVARSIVVESIITGRGVHYARAKEPYRRPRRYRYGDPRFTWHYVTRAMDILHDVGLIEHDVGLWCPRAEGCQSVAWATDELVSLLKPIIDASEPRGIPRRVETVILRRGHDKTEINYVETVDTVTMRDQLSVINDELALLELRRGDQHVGIPTVRRIFNGSFDRGGRLYCHGDSYQNMPAARRREINFIIDGAAHPVVEIDYVSLHIRMAYSEAGKRVPPGDPYAIDCFDRGLVKLAVNTLFNALTKKSAVHAIAEDLYRGGGLSRGECYTKATKVVAAIWRKHYRIREFFGSDCGARFQRQDSDMAVEILAKMIKRTGRCPLPMHDSFLVPEMDAEVLSQTMTEVALEHGLRLGLKESRSHNSQAVPTHPSHPYSDAAIPSPHPSCSYFTMEVTALDLEDGLDPFGGQSLSLQPIRHQSRRLARLSMHFRRAPYLCVTGHHFIGHR
jgi:hypothetical protein